MELSYAARRLTRELRGRPLAKLATVFAMAVSLTVVALFALAATNVTRLGTRWGAGAYLTVYLDDGLAPDRAQAIATALGGISTVASARVVDPSEAYGRLRRALGDRADALDGLDPGFLPKSIEVTLTGVAGDAVLAQPLVDHLRRTPGVTDVQPSGDYARRVSGLFGFARLGAILLALIVLGAALYVMATTTRAFALARRDEIDILGLVGATPRYVAAPFLVTGAVEGLCAAALAAVAAYGAFRVAAPRVEAALDFALKGDRLAFARPGEISLWLAAGLLVGLCGSALAFTRVQHVEA